ncbi:LysR substrate-binding domain-containing protein [Pseudorhodobacter sp.]|uniref:LysR substrate-binding domain-containing protein n=1 Tax=Pseudorhodobacter sp. TaxID=1934400 RepID=UPI002649C21F|nr:LysR substrate-binding domain-containing protein [Pseudorhodobacter sp.]MDN5788831.1 LysR substrate-binding domain-containing protein [Pseudorhodobacter sp.]
MKNSNINTQRRYLPSNAVLRSFECAARHESFTLAAQELHLTQSAVSRQVKELEDIIGAALFRRVGRRVVLTPAGRNFVDELSIDLENIRQTVMRAISAGGTGAAIRVATLPAFASRWLIPRLSGFLTLHPEIEFSFATRLEPFDMAREHFDLAVHFGKADWPGTDMEHLCSETMIAVASPSFKAKHHITSIAGLVDAPLLQLETRPAMWQEYFDRANIETKTARTGKSFDQFTLLIAGAVASLGAALLPTYLIEQEIADGSLVTLDKATLTTGNNYYLVTPEDAGNADVALFTAWMQRCVGQK